MIRHTPSSTLFPYTTLFRSYGTLKLTPGATSTCFCSSRSSANCWSRRDRKSTRLNSSHTVISYAVFCLKKKNVPIDLCLPRTALVIAASDVLHIHIELVDKA